MEHASYMPKRTLSLVCGLILLLMAIEASIVYAEKSSSVPVFEVDAVDEIYHSNDSWTQGFAIYNGSLFESTGNYGNSSLKELDMETGEELRKLTLNNSYFAEGIAIVNDKLILLTWRENIAFVVDLNTFEIISNYSYQGEGWGICYDGTHLVMSDGSNELYFRDPSTFEINNTLNVTISGENFDGSINELECVNNTIYANVWYKNEIISIDSGSGNITSIIEVNGLDSQNKTTYHEILNGIAYDENSNTFLITGKNWPSIYRVKFVETHDLEINEGEIVLDDVVEPSMMMPTLVILFAVIVWALDIKLRRKVKEEVDKPDTIGEVG